MPYIQVSSSILELRRGIIDCLETTLTNQQQILHNIPEEQRLQYKKYIHKTIVVYTGKWDSVN
jgi:hypothetical protein